jgi:hypothetical protein
VTLKLHFNGPFDTDIGLKLEDHGIREVTVPVRGTCTGEPDAKD